MGIRNKDSIDADRRDTHLQPGYVSKERAPESEREILEKRLFKHSEFKKPYSAEDYAQMERDFTFPWSLFPPYTPPSMPDVPPAAEKPEDEGDTTGGPDPERSPLDGECECDSAALSLVFLGVVPDGTPFEGSNDCGVTFNETGPTSTPTACQPEHWEIKIQPCYGECEAFLVMLFNGFGYPRGIQWTHSGAGGEFNIRKIPGEKCFEEASWRVPLKDLFSEVHCSGGNAPRIVLNVDTVSINMDGTSCIGSQEIIVELDINAGADDGESAFSIIGGSSDCENPASTWGFSIHSKGSPLQGEDAFGTGQPWKWTVSDPSHIFITPGDSYATTVIVTVVGVPDICVLTIGASHPCGGDAQTDNACLPIGHATCGWSIICDDVGGSPTVRDCDGDSLSVIEITCDCPDMLKITSVIGCLGCARQPGGGSQICTEINKGNICKQPCPTRPSPNCDGKKSAFVLCMQSKGLGTRCRPACPDIEFACVMQTLAIQEEKYGKI